jgi:hypothetical protein
MIPIQDARGVFTNTLIATWNELTELAPKAFLRSFFTKKTTSSKEVSIEVMRGTEKVAVDVLRGTNGNRNTFSRFTEKMFVPPFYNEYFDATNLDRYDVLFGRNATSAPAPVISGMIDQATEKLMILRYKIERAYELQASQVFESGIVQLTSGDNIDYKRKATSMVVNLPAAYWTNSSIDPRNDLLAGANFLRTTGKSRGGIFKVIVGSNALAALLNHAKIAEYNVINISLVDLKSPQVDSEGAIYIMRLSWGGYMFDIWSYPETYETSAGVATPYINADYFYMVPETGAQLIMSFAGVPAIIRDVRNAEFPEFIGQVEADYWINNYIDPMGKKHVFEILSAGLAIPVSVDRIYSAKVTGTEIVGG